MVYRLKIVKDLFLPTSLYEGIEYSFTFELKNMQDDRITFLNRTLRIPGRKDSTTYDHIVDQKIFAFGFVKEKIVNELNNNSILIEGIYTISNEDPANYFNLNYIIGDKYCIVSKAINQRIPRGNPQNMISNLKSFETTLKGGYQFPSHANSIVKILIKMKDDYSLVLDDESGVLFNDLFEKYWDSEFHVVEPGSVESGFLDIDKGE
jgi:hypothetical protein